MRFSPILKTFYRFIDVFIGLSVVCLTVISCKADAEYNPITGQWYDLTGLAGITVGGTVTGGLASRLLYQNAANQISTANIVGASANQVIVTNSPDGTFTLSTPQDINIGSSVRFQNLGLGASAGTGNASLYTTQTTNGNTSILGVFANTLAQSGGAAEQDNLYGLVQNDVGGSGTYTGGFFGFIGDARLRGTASNTFGIFGGMGQAIVLNTANVSGPVVGVAAFIEHDAGTTVNNTFGFYQYPGFYNGTRTGHHYSIYLSSTPNVGDYSIRAERGIMWMNSGDNNDSDVIFSGRSDVNTFFVSASSNAIGIGTNAPATNTKVHVLTADNTTGVEIQVNATQANVTGADFFLSFNSTTGQEGSVAGTGVAGVIAFNTFTGSHWTKVIGGGLSLLSPLCSTGEVYEESGKEQLVTSRVCRDRKAKNVLGFYGGEDSSGHGMALALGTGFAWVKNAGQNIEAGDWLFTSGDGVTVEKQEDDIQHNYSAAKASQPIFWRNGEKERRIAVTYHAG